MIVLLTLAIVITTGTAKPREDLSKVDPKHSVQEIQNAMLQACFDSLAFSLDSGQTATMSLLTQSVQSGYFSLATAAIRVASGTISLRRESDYIGSVVSAIRRDSSHVIVSPENPLPTGTWEEDIPFLGGRVLNVIITAHQDGTAGTMVIETMRGN